MATLTYNASISSDGTVVVLSSTSGGLSAAAICAVLVKDNQTRASIKQAFEALQRRVSRDFSQYTDDLTQVSTTTSTRE